MALLIDLFGYLSVVLHGLVISGQSVALGGVAFLLLLARPLSARLGVAGPVIERNTTRIAIAGAAGLVLCEGLTIAMQSAVLVGTVGIGVFSALGAGYAVAGLVKIAAAVLLAVMLWRGAAPAAVLLALCAVILAAATLTTHAEARLDDRGILLTVEALHQLGAAIWIGGLPCFVMALGRVHDGLGWRALGGRYSRVSIAGVAYILVSGVTMSLYYIGSWAAFYGTAYGLMVGAKIALFAMLLCLGAGNFLVTERLRANPRTPILRLRRFAEVEIGIGFTVFFAAASLTSVPPGVDLSTDRVAWHEIVERNIPHIPRLVSPDHDVLALPALQAQLDREAAAHKAPPAAAFIPGSGELPPRNAADIAWSEYNHHWAGIFVVAIGLLALLGQAGLRWARHWPLLFIGLGVFLFLRSDPEVWPLGTEGFFSSLRDIEVLQHRVFVLLVVAFGLFEWRVRVAPPGSEWSNGRAALVFPLVCAIGGALLLTHSHAIANVHEQLLIELTHIPVALLSVVAGWSRWLELRLDPPANRIAGWIWPVCFTLIGALLLLYREA